MLSNDFRDDSNRHKISLPHPPTSRGYMWRGRQVYFLVFFFLSLLENLTDFEDFPSPSCPSSCSSSALPGRASTGSSLSCTNRPCAARCEARELGSRPREGGGHLRRRAGVTRGRVRPAATERAVVYDRPYMARRGRITIRVGRLHVRCAVCI